jgi:hypothetical protein
MRGKATAGEPVDATLNEAGLPERVLLPDDAWKVLPPATKEAVYSGVLETIYGEIDAAIEAETFAARDDFHLSRVPLMLDEAAWKHLTTLLEEMLNRIMDLQATTASRLAKDGGGQEKFAATVAILGFESPRKTS